VFDAVGELQRYFHVREKEMEYIRENYNPYHGRKDILGLKEAYITQQDTDNGDSDA